MNNAQLQFLQVDAFTSIPLLGNPAAVVMSWDLDLPKPLMQRIAREMNLSETVFLCAPTSEDADYRVRIFTPQSELPFAGHPTIAAASVVHSEFPEKAAASLLKQECGIGIIPVEIIPTDSGKLFVMTQAPPTYQATSLSRADVSALLGCPEEVVSRSPFEVVSTGVPWLIIELEHIDSLEALRPDFSAIATTCARLKAIGITVFAKSATGANTFLRARTFAPGEGVPEDPVCGSGNGSVAAFLAKNHYPEIPEFSYVAEQGVEIDRRGEIHVSWSRQQDGLQVKIGGMAAVSIRGSLFLKETDFC